MDLEQFVPEFKQLLEKIESRQLPEITSSITVEEMKDAIKVWSERTSTSPSGRHLGIYHALLSPEALDANGNKRSDEIFQIMVILINLCTKHGIALDRWKKIINAMIEKQAGNDRIDRLRVINLFEADFNLILGILWSRRLMVNARKHKALSKCQWGGHKGSTSLDPVLLKVMSMETSAYTCTSLTVNDKDAEACFDRVVMSVSNQRDHQLGMPIKVLVMLGALLSAAWYFIKSALGVSKEYYKSTEEEEIFGTGQGAKHSPPKWTGVSTAGLDVLRDNHDGATFTNPQKTITTNRTSDVYVDDATNWANTFADELSMFEKTRYNVKKSLELLRKLIEESEAMSQCWERILWSTGGKLELTKCFYYILHWVFDEKGRPRLMTKRELTVDNEIKRMRLIDSSSDKRVKIPFKDCRTPHKTLGTMLQGDRQMGGENNV
jgi:hypothetical protein